MRVPNNLNTLMRETDYLKYIKAPASGSYNARYSPRPAMGMAARDIIREPFNPLIIRTRRSYESRDTETLWWQIRVGLDISKKRVVRSWCKRRLREAFIEALKGRGLDANGRRLETAKPGLKGSLVFVGRPNLLTVKFEQLKMDCKTLMDTLQRQNPRLDIRAAPLQQHDKSEQSKSRWRGDEAGEEVGSCSQELAK
ncbi:hypothetical protein M501DRAFT_1015832 [Patellaria atrata CBS 101060]|uniref:Uncharacterized protein n=1 Tax=Patellaria atrata CBS 101060 TaxID=1346257 RepID=A0A9P4SC40_9PEZI|nr:hypothetical protein M501DRAFT_1015832 [Patellaria atrata CBS 101060]